ncbi:MAG: ISAs1 family transposase [Pirellulaceae bacterium]|jgi:predicted transposase YbfD/YdcC|nr:ISAs1 family transposase [Pirellulaceae bacterium]MDP7302675.1 ISAs1 family transposase [Pirellulaceae bacterium]
MAGADVSFDSVVEYFESLPDPRHTRNRHHLLADVIVISVCGVIVGCEGPTAIVRWAKAKEDWLGQLLELPNGIPSRDTVRRVLSTLKPEAFQECFQRWIAECLTDNADGSHRTIAIDGKTMRRSHDRAGGLGPLHMVSAWVSEQGIALGQIATEEKSNEITAIPELIDQIDVQGAVVTIDAMGCQKEIAKKITRSGGDYVLAVKDNQPKLHQAIDDFFVEALEDDLGQVPHRRHETHDKGHGRTDDRYYYLAKLPDDFAFKKQWSGIKAIGMAIRVTEKSDGTESGDVRYFIASRYLSGKRFAQSVRGHWGIENSLHWVLDVTFNEDQSRARERHFADNLSWLRRFAITLLKQHPSKDSIKGKSQIAGWSNEFLTQVLATQRT